MAFLHHPLPPARGISRVEVQDNASIHHARKVQEARADLLAQHNLHLYYLPAYSPKLNDIRHTLRTVKHEAMPQPLQPRARSLTATMHARFRCLRDQLTFSYLSLPLGTGAPIYSSIMLEASIKTNMGA